MKISFIITFLLITQTISCEIFGQKKENNQRKVSELKGFDPEKKAELGRGTWALLHTIAARYPDSPSASMQYNVFQFIQLLSNLYPCEECAQHFRSMLEESPPQLESQQTFAMWLCDLHNRVNVRLGKSEFDCYSLDTRWDCGCQVESEENNKQKSKMKI